MSAYYNENDKFAAAWLRELIKENLIAPGEVDERSIEEVRPDDLKGFTQCHFFAGVGVWSYALRNAGWSDDSPVWTGSCPCQGFSASGKREGFSDKRHLWPSWFRLIRECRPDTIFGEQVSSRDGLAWLDVVSADLENEKYAIGAIDTCAASVGAPHIRQRLYFVADSGRERIRTEGYRSNGGATRSIEGKGHQWQRLWSDVGDDGGGESGFSPNAKDANGRRSSDAHNGGRWTPEAGRSSAVGDCSDSDGRHSSTEGLQRSGEHGLRAADCESRELRDAKYAGLNSKDAEPTVESGDGQERRLSERANSISDNLNAEQSRLEGHTGNVREWRGPGWLDPLAARSVAAAGATRGVWSDCDWWYGRDGKYRPIGPGLFPLAASTPGRVGRLRGYGNALCAPQAQAFIESYMSIASQEL